jgi:hypothetical protein
MLRQAVALPVSYFEHEDALDLYFVKEPWPGMTASTLPCGWCTSQRGMINLDRSRDDVLVSLEVLDVGSVFARDLWRSSPSRERQCSTPRVQVPIAYFPGRTR